jgi:UDP-N-acetylglucosamine transferase subunit ALG13
MIFVTIGTSEPFDRLLRWLDELGPDEELVVQRGRSTFAPRGATCFDYLPYEDVLEYVRGARVVVTHAGAGSVMTCLACGKRPVAVPRLRRYGETADDHQLAFAQHLAEAGLIAVVEEPEQLAQAIADPPAAAAAAGSAAGGLADDLREYLMSAVARRARS